MDSINTINRFLGHETNYFESFLRFINTYNIVKERF